MGWFKRIKEGIVTPTVAKKETPEGLWYKCPSCKQVMTTEDHKTNLWVCPSCGHHERINSREYFAVLFDDASFTELAPKMVSGDPLNFKDTKKYKDRLKDAQAKTGLGDALSVAHGKLNDLGVVIACMNFNFIGGSMGSVVGEKISRAIDYCIANKYAFMIISKSGGARMMEAGYSLMQMAKVSGNLGLLSEEKLPYISYLTDPTTGGVTASFAMLGDINIAEPGALIAFAGPRVVRETIGRDLPDGFQTAEFLLEHGFLDFIIDRTEIREKLSQAIRLFMN